MLGLKLIHISKKSLQGQVSVGVSTHKLYLYCTLYVTLQQKDI